MTDKRHDRCDYDAGLPPSLRRRTIVFDSVDSTNRVARDWAADGASDGSIVLADIQTSGRGRLGRTWVAPPGEGLLMSMVVDFDAPLSSAGRLSIAAGCAVAATIESVLADTCRQSGKAGRVRASEVSNDMVDDVDLLSRNEVGIKWPNDVLIAGRKCAGILVESHLSDKGRRFVVGIGINVNQQSVGDWTRYPSTSLKIACGDSVKRPQVLKTLVGKLDQFIGGLQTEQRNRVDEPVTSWSAIMAYYRSRLHRPGSTVAFAHTKDESTIRGIFRGVSDAGDLLLEINGEVTAYSAGELAAGDYSDIPERL